MRSGREKVVEGAVSREILSGSDVRIVRLNRFLALSGVSSRRGAEEFIRNGRVALNGKLTTDLATQVAPADEVRVDGHVVRTQRVCLSPA